MEVKNVETNFIMMVGQNWRHFEDCKPKYMGNRGKNTSFLFSAVIILGSAAIMRIVAWQVYDADFATTFIIVELITTIMILASIVLFKKKENVIENVETADD